MRSRRSLICVCESTGVVSASASAAALAASAPSAARRRGGGRGRRGRLRERGGRDQRRQRQRETRDTHHQSVPNRVARCRRPAPASVPASGCIRRAARRAAQSAVRIGRRAAERLQELDEVRHLLVGQAERFDLGRPPGGVCWLGSGGRSAAAVDRPSCPPEPESSARWPSAVVVVPDHVLERPVVAVVHVRRGDARRRAGWACARRPSGSGRSGRAVPRRSSDVSFSRVAASSSSGRPSRAGALVRRQRQLPQAAPSAPEGRQVSLLAARSRSRSCCCPRAVGPRGDVVAHLRDADVVELACRTAAAVVAVDARRLADEQPRAALRRRRDRRRILRPRARSDRTAESRLISFVS